MAPELSVILPCFRSASVAEASVRRLSRYFEETRCDAEIIVVDDGGRDFPDGPWEPAARTRLVRLPKNRGKGRAVAEGMRVAHGRVRAFTDVDLPYDLELFHVILAYIRDHGFHVVIGDRTLPDSSYSTEQSVPRRLASWVFSQFVGRIVTGGFFDTQCGLKGLRGDVADEIFSLQRLDRFSFDVELVYLALKHKLDIKRIPVRLRNNATSSVRLGRDAARGFLDVFRIKWYQLRGVYKSHALEEIVRDDFIRILDRTIPGAIQGSGRDAGNPGSIPFVAKRHGDYSA